MADVKPWIILLYRQSVISLCKELLSSDHVSPSITPQLMACLKYVLKSPHERMQEVANIISDIQMPNVVEEQVVDPDKLHQLKYKVSGQWSANVCMLYLLMLPTVLQLPAGLHVYHGSYNFCWSWMLIHCQLKDLRCLALANWRDENFSLTEAL